MFDRKPCLPIDIIFDTNTAELKGNTSTKHVKNLKQTLQWVFKTANEVLKKVRNEINDIMNKKSGAHS